MGNDFELDGAGLLDALIMASGVEKDKDNNKSLARLIKVFHKYGLNTFQGLAMLLEITAAFSGGENNAEM
jgi:hypothetical protein